MDVNFFLLWNSFPFSLHSHPPVSVSSTVCSTHPTLFPRHSQLCSYIIYFTVLIISIHIRRRIVPMNIHAQEEERERESEHNMLCCSYIYFHSCSHYKVKSIHNCLGKMFSGRFFFVGFYCCC